MICATRTTDGKSSEAHQSCKSNKDRQKFDGAKGGGRGGVTCHERVQVNGGLAGNSLAE